MSKLPAAKISFGSVTSDNEDLAAEIRTYVAQQQTAGQPQAEHDGTGDGDKALKDLIRRLYGRMCDFSRYMGPAATPDKKIVAAWETFLEAIRALADVHPHGPLIAARMVLYLANAFASSCQLPRRLARSNASVKVIELRCDFLLAMDDTLLTSLTALWTQSRHREMYQWVFTDYPVRQRRRPDPLSLEGLPEEIRYGPLTVAAVEGWHEEESRERFETACLTSPDQLPPVRPGRLWVRSEGDTTPYSRHPEATRWASEDHESGHQLIMWQYVGNDGPIRADYNYEVVDEDTGQCHWRGRRILQRSRQFILDARRIAARTRFLDTQAAARDMLAHSRLPIELQYEIMTYIDSQEPPEHPYLSKLDLSQVYRPFPARGRPGKCDACPARAASAADKMARSTCPHKAITIWSLPLRTFHTLHHTSAKANNTWRVCALESCAGHHPDASWRAPAPRPGAFLDALVSSRCGAPGGASGGTTAAALGDVGLGPSDPVELPTEEEDNDRKRRLFERRGPLVTAEEDRVEEALWTGIGGLECVMRSGEVLMGRHPSGRTTTRPAWAFGRTVHEESRALDVFKSIMRS